MSRTAAFWHVLANCKTCGMSHDITLTDIFLQDIFWSKGLPKQVYQEKAKTRVGLGLVKGLSSSLSRTQATHAISKGSYIV